MPSVIAWILEPTDITRHWVWFLCQGLYYSCLSLLPCLFLVRFALSKWKGTRFSLGDRFGILQNFFPLLSWDVWKYASGHHPSALYSTFQWVLKHLAESEQILLSCPRQNSSIQGHTPYPEVLRFSWAALSLFHPFGTSWSLSHLSIGCCSNASNVSVFVAHQWLHLMLNPVYLLWPSLVCLDCCLWHRYAYLLESLLVSRTVVKGVFPLNFPWMGGLPGLLCFVFLSLPVCFIYLFFYKCVNQLIWSDFSAVWWFASLSVAALWTLDI